MPKDSLKTFTFLQKKHFSTAKYKVELPANQNRSVQNNANTAVRLEKNITDRLAKLTNLINVGKTYRTSLRFDFCITLVRSVIQ